MNCLSNMERITLKVDMVMDLIKVYEFKGKEFYYDNCLEDDSLKLMEEIIYENTFFVAKLFDLDITDARLKLLIKKDLVPKNKTEVLINNIKQVFNEIQFKKDGFEYTPNQFLDFARFLFKNYKQISFNQIKTIDKSLLKLERKTKSKREELNNLLKDFQNKLDSNLYELTLLITNFYVDFLNMDIFTSNNEELGIFILYILLYKEGFNVFKYVSFFNILYKNYESFKKTILQANFNWDEGFSQTKYLNQLIIRFLLEGYKKLEPIVRDYLFEKELNKSDSIENIILKFDNLFTKDDIRLKYPYVSDSTINRTLKRLRDENKIKPLGTGRSAKWIKTIETPQKIKIEKEKGLFDFSD